MTKVTLPKTKKKKEVFFFLKKLHLKEKQTLANCLFFFCSLYFFAADFCFSFDLGTTDRDLKSFSEEVKLTNNR
jgi:hypothetical protein